MKGIISGFQVPAPKCAEKSIKVMLLFGVRFLLYAKICCQPICSL